MASPSQVAPLSVAPDPPDPPPPSPPSPTVGTPSPPQSIPTSPPQEVDLSPPPSSSRDLAALKLQTSSIPAGIPSTAAPSYAERFKASLRNLRKISSPSFLEDGTPVVQAPESVLLSTADLWKDHIVAHFHGAIPPSKKIFDDLNPVWGKFGKITIRVTSETSCLIYIPSVQTREWVLQVGYWQAAHCAFSVFPWSPDGNLAPQDLESAPTWVILRNVPPQLYSLDGISVIASGIGEPLHTEKSRLDPYNFGNTKIKVEIDLHGVLPAEVEVRDSAGFSVRVKAEYPSLPPKCCNCGRFGHYLNRCLMPPQKKSHAGKDDHTLISSKVALVKSKIPLSEEGEIIEGALPAHDPIASVSSKPTTRRRKSRSRSRGRKKGLGKASLESNNSQLQAPEQRWVPVGSTQPAPEPLTEDVVVNAPDQGDPRSEPNPDDELSLETKTTKQAIAAPQIATEHNDNSLDEEPWQVMQSKRKKRAQLQEALWRSPSASTAKALRFRVRAQAAAGAHGL